MAIRDSRGGDLDPNLRGLGLGGTTQDGDEAKGDSTSQATEKTPAEVAAEIAALPLSPIDIREPMPPQRGIVADNPARIRQQRAYDYEVWFQNHQARKRERQRFAESLRGIRVAGEALSTPGRDPADAEGPVVGTQETVDQDLFDAREEDTQALQPPTTLQEETLKEEVDQYYKNSTRRANQRVFDLGEEQVDRAFGDLPDEVRLTEASDEFAEANLAAIANPVKPINEALERAQITVEQAFAARKEQLEEDRNIFTAMALTAGEGAITLAASFAEIGAQFNLDPNQRAISREVADKLLALTGVHATGTDEYREFTKAMQAEVDELRKKEGVGLFEAFGQATKMFGGRQGGKIIDNFIDRVQAFGITAVNDPRGAFDMAALTTAQAAPSLVAMMGTGAFAQAANISTKGVMFLTGSMLETGANLSDAAHDPDSGIRRDLDAVDLGVSVGFGVAGGSLEAIGAAKVLKGMQRATRASNSFKRLNRTKQRAFWREVGQGFRSSQAEGLGEGGTEIAQQIFSNAAAKIGWEPERDLTEGVIESFIGGYGAGTLLPLPARTANVIRSAKSAVRAADLRQQADANASKFAGVSSDILALAIQNEVTDSNLDLPVPPDTNARDYSLELNRRAIYMTPEQMQNSNPQEVLNEYEARALPAEHNILFITDEQGTPVHQYQGRENIERVLNDVKQKGKQAAFQEEGHQEVAPTVEEGPEEGTTVPVAEEGTTEEVADVIEDPVRAAVIAIPDENGQPITVEGMNHGVAIQNAVAQGLLEVDENGDAILPEGTNIDLFVTESGEYIDRFQASERFGGRAGAETLIEQTPQEEEARAQLDAQATPVLEETEIEALQTELEQIDEELGELDALADTRDSGELTTEESDRRAELEQRSLEIISQLPVAPVTDEEIADNLKRFRDATLEQNQLSIKALQEFLRPDLTLMKTSDIEQMLEVDSEQKVLPYKARRAIRAELGARKGKSRGVTEEAPVIEEPEPEPAPPVKQETKAEKEARQLEEMHADMLAVDAKNTPSRRQGQPIRVAEEVWAPLMAWTSAKVNGQQTRVLTRTLNRLLKQHEVWTIDELVESDRPIFPDELGGIKTISDQEAGRVAKEIINTTNAFDDSEVASYARPFEGYWEVWTQPADIDAIADALQAASAAPNLVTAVKDAARSHETYWTEEHNAVHQLYLDAETAWRGNQVAAWQNQDSSVNWDRQGIGAIPNQQDPTKRHHTIMTPSQFLTLVPTRPTMEGVDHIQRVAQAGQPVAPPFLTVQREDTAWRVVQHGGRGRAMVAESLEAGARIPVDVFFVDENGNGIDSGDMSRLDLERDIRGEEQENFTVSLGQNGYALTTSDIETVLEATEDMDSVTEEAIAPELEEELNEYKQEGQGVGTPDSENVIAPTIGEAAGINPATREEVQTAVSRTLKRMKLPDTVAEVVVFEKADDVATMGYDPRQIRSVDPNSGALMTRRGFLDLKTGRVIFVAENMLENVDLQEQIDQLIAHEVVVHIGFRKMFGAEFVSTLAGYYDQYQAKDRLAPIIEDYAHQLDTTDGRNVESDNVRVADIISGKVELTPNAKSIVMEEMFASFAEDEVWSDLRTFRTKDPLLRRMFKALVNKIRQFFRNRGFSTAFTDEFMHDLIMRSAANLRVGAGTATEQDLARLGSNWQLANANDQAAFNQILSMTSNWSEEAIAGYQSLEVWPGELIGLIEQNGGMPVRDTFLNLTDAALNITRTKAERAARNQRYADRRYRAGNPTVRFAGTKTASVAGARSTVENHAAQSAWGNKGVESPYFKKWFRNSVVVDKDGNPLVVYQGTRGKFYQFSTDAGAESVLGPGTQFTTNKQESKEYAAKRVLLGDIGAESFKNSPSEEEMSFVQEGIKLALQTAYGSREQQFPAFNAEFSEEFSEKLPRIDNTEPINFSEYANESTGAAGFMLRDGTAWQIGQYTMHAEVMQELMFPGKQGNERLERLADDVLAEPFFTNALDFGLSMTGAVRWHNFAETMNVDVFGRPSNAQKSAIARRLKNGVGNGIRIEYHLPNGLIVSEFVSEPRDLSTFWRKVADAERTASVPNDSFEQWESFFDNNPDVVRNPDKFMRLMHLQDIPLLDMVREKVEETLGRKFEPAYEVGVPQATYDSYLSLQNPIDFNTDAAVNEVLNIVEQLGGSRVVFARMRDAARGWRNSTSAKAITSPMDWAADALVGSELVNARNRTTVGKPMRKSEAMRLIVQQLSRKGYDGVVSPGPSGSTYYVAWSTDQIKMTDNVGTFMPKDTDIRFAGRKKMTAPLNTEGVKDLLDQLEAKILGLERKIPTLETRGEILQNKRDVERLRVERDKVLSMLDVDANEISAKAVDVENVEIEEAYIDDLNALVNGEGVSEVDIQQGVMVWNEGARDLQSFTASLPNSVRTKPSILWGAVLNRVMSRSSMAQIDNSARNDHVDFNRFQGEVSNAEYEYIDELPTNLDVSIKDVKVTEALSVMDNDRIMRRVNEKLLSTVNRFRAPGWLPVEQWRIKEINASFTKGGKDRIANYGAKLRQAMDDKRIPSLRNIRQISQASDEAITFFEQTLQEAIDGRDEFMFTDQEAEWLREVYSDFVPPNPKNYKTIKDLWRDIRRAVFEPSISIKIDWMNEPYTFNRVDIEGLERPGISDDNTTKAIREAEWADVVAQRVAKNVAEIARRALAGDPIAQNMLRQRRWYTNMRKVLRHKYGAFGELFADLLGATSARQAVDENYTQASEAMDLFFRGKYDHILDIYERYLVYREMFVERKAIQDGELKRAKESGDQQRIAIAETKEQEITDKITNYLANNADIQLNEAGRYDGPVVLKENDKKFGINSEAVMRALVNVYRIVRQGQTPKTRNFTGNLIGYSDDATVDVWAARYLQRLAGDGRIPPPLEGSVTGNIKTDLTPGGQFGFGQLVFKLATDRINGAEHGGVSPFQAVRDYNEQVNDEVFVAAPHELQALLWFGEKEVWAENGWTTRQGEGGSYEHAASRTQSDRFTIISADNDVIASKLVDDDVQRSALVSNPTLSIVEGDVVESGFVEILGTEDVDASELALAALEQAAQSGEPNVVLSRVLQNSEINDNARPGGQIAFRESVALEKAEALLRWLKSQGITQAILLRDSRSFNEFKQSEENKAFGIQIMTVPEVDIQTDTKLANRLRTPAQVDDYIETQRQRIRKLLAEVRDQAERSDIDVSMALYELHDILAVNEKDYESETERFKELVATASEDRTGESAGRSTLTGTWGITRNRNITQRAAEWRGDEGASNIATAQTQEEIRTVRRQFNSGAEEDLLAASQWLLRELGAQTIDVRKAFDKWQMNVPAYIEEYASLWENIQEADILSIPTRKKGETDAQLHRRQFDRGLQSIREVLNENVAYDPIDINANTQFVQVPYDAKAPINMLLEFALIETARVTAARHVPPTSDPVLHIDATLSRVRKQLADLGIGISNREFARFYQMEMGRSLLDLVGVTDHVMSQIGFVARPRRISDVRETAQALYENLRPQGTEDANIRYARRTPAAKVEWVDSAGRPRRTLRNMTLREVQQHTGYEPDAAERTQVSNTTRTYERLAREYLNPDDDILDYGGGLGAGTARLRELGFKVDLYEPFSNPDRRVTEPDFERADAEDVPYEYDKVVSSFVLNVVPQDIRDFIVEKALSRLRVGGEAIFLARPWSSVKETLKTDGTVDLGNRQVLTTRGTYQRGYQNSVELAQEIEDILGPENFVVQTERGTPTVRVLKLSEPQRSNTDIRYAGRIENPNQSEWDRIIEGDEQLNVQADDVQDTLELMAGRESRRPVGAPEYANQGTSEERRMGVDKTDDLRKAQGMPTYREQQLAREQALEMLADPELRQGLIDRINQGVVSNSDVEAAASAILIDETWADAFEDPTEANVERVLRLTSQLRTNRGHLARALAIGRDPLKSPAERHHDMIKRVIYTYPPFERLDILLQEEIRKSRGQETEKSIKLSRALKRLMALQRKRMRAFQAAMNRHGYDITALPESLLADESQVVAVLEVLHAADVSLLKELVDTIKRKDFQNLPTAAKDALTDQWDRLWDNLLEWRINSLLSSLHTFARNNVSNTFRFLTEYFALRPIQGVLNEVRGKRSEFAAYLAKQSFASDPESVRGKRRQRKADMLALTEDDARWGETMDQMKWLLTHRQLLARSFVKAWKRASHAYKHEMPTVEDAVLPGREGRSQFERRENRRSIKGKLGRTVRIPGRSLIFFDEYIKSMEIDFEAAILARRLGKRLGKKGDALEQYILEQTFDPASESHGWIMKQAIRKALELTFQTPLDARAHRNVMDKAGLWVIKTRGDRDTAHIASHVVPFVTVPVNLRREVLKTLPPLMLGVTARRVLWNKVSDTYTYDISKRYEDYSWIIFGSIVTTALAMLGAGLAWDDEEGEFSVGITGNPTPFDIGDPIAMKEYYLEQQGIVQPMSIKIGSHWISYANVDPLSSTIANSVDMVQGWRKWGEGSPASEQFVEFLKDLYKSSLGASYMEGLDQFIQAVTDPSKNGRYYLTNFMSSFMPNIARTTVRSFDNESELIDTAIRGEDGMDQVLSMTERIGRSALPLRALASELRVDPLGRSMIRDDGAPFTDNPVADLGYRIVMPFKVRDTRKNHPIIEAFVRWNAKQTYADGKAYPPMPSRNVQIDKVGYDMADEKAEYQELARRTGTMAREVLEAAIRDGDIDVYNPSQRDMEFINKVFSEARKNSIRTMRGDGLTNPFVSSTYIRHFAETYDIPEDEMVAIVSESLEAQVEDLRETYGPQQSPDNLEAFEAALTAIRAGQLRFLPIEFRPSEWPQPPEEFVP